MKYLKMIKLNLLILSLMISPLLVPDHALAANTTYYVDSGNVVRTSNYY